MASIRENRPGVFEVREYVGRDRSGRPRQVSRMVRGTLKAAKRVAAELSFKPSSPEGSATTLGEVRVPRVFTRRRPIPSTCKAEGRQWCLRRLFTGAPQVGDQARTQHCEERLGKQLRSGRARSWTRTSTVSSSTPPRPAPVRSARLSRRSGSPRSWPRHRRPRARRRRSTLGRVARAP
jgi:hypothetical protein